MNSKTTRTSCLFLLWLSLSLLARENGFTITYRSLQFTHNFNCDGSAGIKIALHDLQLANFPVGQTTQFRLRLFQEEREIEELRITLPENDFPPTKLNSFSGEALWFCLAYDLIENYAYPQQEFIGSIELIESETEEILWRTSFKEQLLPKQNPIK